MNAETMSLAAYIPYTILPEYVQEQIKKEFKYLRQQPEYDDTDTICYIRKEHNGSANEYTMHVTVVYSENEPPDDSIIYLTELTDEEQQLIDTMIQIRVIQALRHIDD